MQQIRIARTFFSGVQKRGLSIKNEKLPQCIDCAYFIKSTHNNDKIQEFSKCRAFGEKNVISGIIRYDYAEIARDNASKCGIDGKKFVKAPDNSLLLGSTLI